MIALIRPFIEASDPGFLARSTLPFVHDPEHTKSCFALQTSSFGQRPLLEPHNTTTTALKCIGEVSNAHRAATSSSRPFDHYTVNRLTPLKYCRHIRRGKPVHLDMQAQAQFSSLPVALGILPLVFDPVWAPYEKSSRSLQGDSYEPQSVNRRHEQTITSEALFSDSNELAVQDIFEYPFEEDDVSFNFDTAFEAFAAGSDLTQYEDGGRAQTPLEQTHSFTTFAWAQSSTSPKAWVNPRYLSSAKHARVESATISPRTLKRPCIPSPVAISPKTHPTFRGEASTLRGDATPFTPGWSLVWEAPDTLDTVSEKRKDSVEGTEAYALRRGHSAAAIELIQSRLRVDNERSREKARKRCGHVPTEDRSQWVPRHKKNHSTPSSFGFGL